MSKQIVIHAHNPRWEIGEVECEECKSKFWLDVNLSAGGEVDFDGASFRQPPPPSYLTLAAS